MSIGGDMAHAGSPPMLKLGRAVVQRILWREGLRAIAPKRFVPQTTDSGHGQPNSPNLLQGGLNAPTAKGEVLVGDITYLRLQSGAFVTWHACRISSPAESSAGKFQSA